MIRLRVVWCIALGVPSGLSGCSNGPEASYPASVRAMLKRELPADGRVHAQSRGNFRITPATHFCTYRPGYGLDGKQVTDALTTIGQSDSDNGAARANGVFGERVSPDCKDHEASSPVFIHGREALGRNGKPYRLTLILWQGDAAWIGSIERPEGKRADAIVAYPPINDGPSFFGPTRAELEEKERLEDSRLRDMQDLSNAALNNLVRSRK